MNALTIDLTGQVASEHLGPPPYAGPGGQPEIAIAHPKFRAELKAATRRLFWP